MTYLYKKNLERVSLYISIFSLFLVILGFSIPLGALGLIMALMSRGSGELGGTGKVAMGLSIAALSIGLLMYIWSFYLLYSGALGDLEQIFELYGLQG